MDNIDSERLAERLLQMFHEGRTCDRQTICYDCFHRIENVDFRHISWLIILCLEGNIGEEELYESLTHILGGEY